MTTQHAVPIARQRQFYADTAGQYERMHARDEHQRAIDLSISFMRTLGVRSVLDTGCGTGLGMLAIEKALPATRVHGNDPSAELLQVARTHGIPDNRLDCVGSEALPYEASSFDAVIETAVLHHVPAPEKILDEMLRVARVAVFLSDDNFYGTGSIAARLAKIGLAAAGLLPAVTRLRRSGHLWRESEGDGISWDYSVFAGAEYLSAAGAEVHIIPTAGDRRGSLRRGLPLIFASHGLVIALKHA
jgi:2-polyprenyl-3-methyl-5-hydroxy-6-metoxy-1,4-benzoquinol methylase